VQAGCHGGDQRVARVTVRDIGARALAQPGRRQHHFAARRDLTILAGEVCQRREQHQRPGQRLAELAQPQCRGHRKAAARRVASDHDLPGLDTLAEQAAIGRHRVVQSCGKGMLGRQAVVRNEEARFAAYGQVTRKRAVRPRRARRVASTVQVQDDR